ncbi:MAG: hypothetical protein QF662_08425, partial [Phycisphaerae bacterium]|nr:hypothetical protein [Phycisphaerae bacterium]
NMAKTEDEPGLKEIVASQDIAVGKVARGGVEAAVPHARAAVAVQTEVAQPAGTLAPTEMEAAPVVAGAPVLMSAKLADVATEATSAEPLQVVGGPETALQKAQPVGDKGAAEMLAAEAVEVGRSSTGEELADAQPLMTGGPRVDVAGSVAAERAPARMDLAVPGEEAGDGIEVDTAISAVASVGQPEVVSKMTHRINKLYSRRRPDKRKKGVAEDAVERALEWFAKVQSDDGRWDIEGFKTVGQVGGAGAPNWHHEDVGVTGLTLLSFLGAGYTHVEGKHKQTVAKAVSWLIARQQPNGDLRGGASLYSQGIATSALCETYSLTRDRKVLKAATKAVKFILDSQNPNAGWRYYPRNDSDTSVLGWQILALRSAEIAGIKIPPQHFQWASAWLDKCRTGKNGGLYSYVAGQAATHSMTAEGWFCQLF